MEEWFKEKGTKHECTSARIFHCNRVVKRANKSIIKITMLVNLKMSLDSLAEATYTAVHRRTLHKM